jgi:hypothetical protein
MLDIDERVGALVVYLPERSLGQEIEAEPVARGDRDPAEPLVHTAVRERLMPGATLYAAVFPSLAPGEYRLWVGGGVGPPLAMAIVTGGTVAEVSAV